MAAPPQQSKISRDRIDLDSDGFLKCPFRRCPPSRSWSRCVGVFLVVYCGVVDSGLTARGLLAAEVSIVSADGSATRGELVDIGKAGVRIRRQAETATLPLEDLSQLSFNHETRPPLPMRAELSGGSLLSLTGITWTDDLVKLSVARQSPLSAPARQLRWVRFRAGTPATDPTWLGWLEESRRADRLVVRRNDRALDSVEGTVVEIDRDAVTFEMRGNAIDAPMAKLEGILFSNLSQEATDASVRLTDTSGSEWIAESIRMSAGESEVVVVIAGGIEHKIPIDQVRQIKFAGGILSLTEAEVATASFGGQSNLASKAANSAELNEWFGPQTDNGLIRVHAPGEITLRIPDGYQKLIVAARRSREVSEFTALRLSVLLDGDVKWTATLRNRESLGLELPISEARQLTLRASRMSGTSDASVQDGAALGGGVEWFSGRLLK